MQEEDEELGILKEAEKKEEEAPPKNMGPPVNPSLVKIPFSDRLNTSKEKDSFYNFEGYYQVTSER